MGDVEQHAAIARVHDPGEVVEQVKVSHVEVRRRILGQHLEAGGVADAAHAAGDCLGRFWNQDRRHQNAVTAVARPHMPESGVAAQPSRADLARERGGRRAPSFVGVLFLLEVEIEEVVGGGRAGAGPGACRLRRGRARGRRRSRETPISRKDASSGWRARKARTSSPCTEAPNSLETPSPRRGRAATRASKAARGSQVRAGWGAIGRPSSSRAGAEKVPGRY
jgi:hypothetical protein